MSDMGKVLNEIEILEQYVKEHYQRMNDRSTWLFISLIGCWGISITWVQVLAVILVFYFFYRDIFDGLRASFNVAASSYGKRVKSIQDNIDNLHLDKDREKILNEKLNEVKRSYIDTLASFKHNSKFLVAMVFCAISLFYFLGVW